MVDEKQGVERRGPMQRKPPDIMGDDRIFLAWHRSHMANERTFLAWCRTTIALIIFGFVIERMESSQLMRQILGSKTNQAPTTSSEWAYLSLLCFVLAAGAILISGFRFLRNRRHINNGEASFSPLPDVLVIIAVIIVLSFALMLSIPKMGVM
jgi:putative membrane protein